MEQRFTPFYKDGLTSNQVAQQIRQGNKNNEPENITKTTAEIVKDNVFTLFNLYNFLIAFALIAVKAYSNLFFILVILLNIAIGIIQELRAKKMVESLAVMTAPKTIVVRDGKEQEIHSEDIVLDDIVIFMAGQQVTADSFVQYGVVEVNESLLTGESEAILKQQNDLLLSGSFVVSGKCYAQVKNISLDNYIAQVTQEAKKHKIVFSELRTSMKKVTKFTSLFIIPMGLLLFLEAYYLRSNTLQMAVTTTAAALLGMLPKGLMLLISISLGAGVLKLAQRKVLVQELYALESLAHADVLCLDKTGTITEGKMHVEKVYMLNEEIAQEKFLELMQKFLAAVDDNNATFKALSAYFGERETTAMLGAIPFSSERKWSSASFTDIGTVLLGAPERLLAQDLPQNIQAEIIEGGRVLIIGHTMDVIESSNLPAAITPLAAILLIDPIRKNAQATLEYFRHEDVAIKIISGDNPRSVSGIARRAGFADYDSYIDMSQVTHKKEIAAAAKKYNIFGRVSPQQKKALILALKAQGHTVAMTGDGVNDVLALREADCSIAIAEGSDAAKQISQIVLLDSDFAALPEVVNEGRRVVNNITKLASIFFIKTIYSIFVSLFCIILNMPFPFIPIQITLIDLVIEGYPAFFMSFEESNEKIAGKFLPTVVRHALPHALTITFFMLLMLSAQYMIFVEIESMTTVMYYIIGFVSILAVIKASKPLNSFRMFLCVTVVIGFYLATFLFHNILKITLLNPVEYLLFFFFAFLSIECGRILSIIVDRFFNKYNEKRLKMK